MGPPHNGPFSPRPDAFPSTHWSIIAQARTHPSPAANEALATLCRAYWYPLYVFLRRQVGSPDRAEDLTQEFFARLLAGDFLAHVSCDGGKFRAYLLACCKHFLANQRDRDNARKRGGGHTILSLDWSGADERYGREPADTLTPERLFERRWVLTLLDQVLEQLRLEYHNGGKAGLYDALKGALLGEGSAATYAQIGAGLGQTEAAVKKAAQRLRQRYRDILRQHIAATVDGEAAIDDEIRALFAVLGS